MPKEDNCTANKSNEEEEIVQIEDDEDGIPQDNDKDEETEYTVEAIRKKRVNRATGQAEYLIKWEGYDEDSCTWEPVEHLECPKLLAEFEGNLQKASRPRRAKLRPRRVRRRPKRECTANSSLHQKAGDALIEQNGYESSGGSSATITDNESLVTEPKQPALSPSIRRSQEIEKQPEATKEAGVAQPLKDLRPSLELEAIIGAVTDEDDSLWFMVKRKNAADEVEMLPVIELEENAPRLLCAWYRQRLYHSIRIDGEPTIDGTDG